MTQSRLVPLDRPEVAPLAISPRLRSQLVYFVGTPDPGVGPPPPEGEFYFAPADVARWVDEGVFYLVSPLDTANMTEVELSEEQESLVQWLHAHGVQHVRLTG